jgi:hypothetical protein
MPKQVFAAAAILFLIGGTPGLYAAEIDILKKAEQAEQLPSFGPPTHSCNRALARPATPFCDIHAGLVWGASSRAAQ